MVSKNGNLLLNVGPKSDGSIPDNQLKRLLDLGDWMRINGEGIYGTQPWKIASTKLSDGTEVRFTKKNDDLYVFLLSKPNSQTIELPSIKIGSKSKAILYGSNSNELPTNLSSDGLILHLPDNMKFEFASMIKITHIE